MHTRICTHTKLGTRYTHMHAHTHPCTDTHTYKQVRHTHTYAHTKLGARYTHMHAHTYMHRHTYMQAADTHTHMHTHKIGIHNPHAKLTKLHVCVYPSVYRSPSHTHRDRTHTHTRTHTPQTGKLGSVYLLSPPTCLPDTHTHMCTRTHMHTHAHTHTQGSWAASLGWVRLSHSQLCK
jgi:hypothetical protein